jgi:mRNA interferase HicA
VKRGDLLRHLRKHGCHLKREGRSHSLWTNPATGAVEVVPRHAEISDILSSQDMPWPFCPGARPVSLVNKRLERPGATPPAQPER